MSRYCLRVGARWQIDIREHNSGSFISRAAAFNFALSLHASRPATFDARAAETIDELLERMPMSKPLAVGDRVAFSASFLRNTGQSFEAAQMRGTVGQIDDIGGSHLCRVNWDEGCPTSVLDTNLARVGSLRFSEA